MLHTVQATRGIVTAPHHLANETGLAILREGGNAVEAMLGMAATIAVVYPHMNAIGGDGFWLIAAPGAEAAGIDAAGIAAADIAFYRESGSDRIPFRGPLAANTVAGTLAGWAQAKETAGRMGGRLPWSRLLADAIGYARDGFPVSDSQHRYTREKIDELRAVPGFAPVFLNDDGAAPPPGSLFRQPALAATLTRLAEAGPIDFYKGDLAALVAQDLAAVGSPVGRSDLDAYAARRVVPLVLPLSVGTAYNLPPPTQGLASLMILGLFDRMNWRDFAPDEFRHIHTLVEATKRAFTVRDRDIADPDVMAAPAQTFITAPALDDAARGLEAGTATPWGPEQDRADTVWMGAIDGAGRAVSFIQSIYWEFGAGVVLPETGILWQNRGASFSLDPGALRAIAPGRRPFHTLNPALATLKDGRTLVYGAMGGDGQPQSQAALFTRIAMFGQALQTATTAPRWLLGRTWGAESTSLKLEDRFEPQVIEALRDAGHTVELVAPFDDLMGHAGALARDADGILTGAGDPRSDGMAAGF